MPLHRGEALREVEHQERCAHHAWPEHVEAGRSEHQERQDQRVEEQAEKRRKPAKRSPLPEPEKRQQGKKEKEFWATDRERWEGRHQGIFQLQLHRFYGNLNELGSPTILYQVTFYSDHKSQLKPFFPHFRPWVPSPLVGEG